MWSAKHDGLTLSNFTEENNETSVLNLLPECSDGFDNDNNGSIDYPNDINCTSFMDDDESMKVPISAPRLIKIIEKK